MPPQQPNQYDFIMGNNAKPGKRLPLGNNKLARALVVVVIIIIVGIIAAVANSFLTKDSQVQTNRLVEIAQSQSELIRVSSIAKTKAKDLDTRNFALNTQITVETSQQQIIKTLNARGVKSKGLNKQLGAAKNAKTDAALDEATRNNRFDATFTTILNKQIADYQKLLQGAYAGSTPKEKTTLTAAFENAGILLKQTPVKPNQ